MISAQYIAGFFDGEGCVAVYKSAGKHNSYGLRTQLAQNKTPESTFLFSILKDTFGGNLSEQVTLTKRIKYNWQLNGDKAVAFLEFILPHTIMKGEQIRLAIDWQRSRPKMIRNAKGQVCLSEPADLERTIEVMNRLKALKKRGSMTDKV